MPVANAAELIRRAYILAQIWDVGEEQPGVEANEGLQVLNLILTNWSSLSTLIPAYTTLSIPLVLHDFLIVETMVIADVLEGHILDSGNCQTPLYECNLQEYNRLNFNNTSGCPDRFYIESSQTDIQTKTNIYFWPPCNASYTATLYIKKALAEVTLVNAMTVFPLFWFKPLLYQMAKDLADIYLTTLSPRFDSEYKDIMASLKQVNRKDLSVQVRNEFFEGRRLRPWNNFTQ